MKKLLAMLLALALVFSLCACKFGDQDKDDDKDDDEKVEDTEEAEEEETEEDPEEDPEEEETEKEDPEEEETEKEDPEKEPDDEKRYDVLEDDDLKYVMIYNPNIYDENQVRDDSVLNTGALGSQVDVDAYRGDGLEEEDSGFMDISQGEIMDAFPVDLTDLEINRGNGLSQNYEEGDVRDFYCFNDGYGYSMERISCEFTCAYAGEYCNVWVIDGDLSESDAKEYGEEFDENIYEDVTALFGEARFVGDGYGKVNLLFYPLYDNYLGLFYFYDLLATGELPKKQIEEYGLNVDHAILNINSKVAGISAYSEMVCATMAHEYQHMICGTDALYAGIECRTWLNEAMSGYIEEYLYSGTKESDGHYKALMKSDRIRYGQSMYNFETDMEDIGVYGSVYMFSEYLADLAGDDVFSEIHEYWRESYSDTLSEAEAMAEAVSSSVYKKINKSIDYDGAVEFDSKNEEWMSKLIFNFYLALLAQDDVEAFEEIKVEKLLYSEINEANIEGGGRIIFAVKDGSFEIPDDADNGLVYVGLNEDFEVVTDIIIK